MPLVKMATSMLLLKLLLQLRHTLEVSHIVVTAGVVVDVAVGVVVVVVIAVVVVLAAAGVVFIVADAVVMVHSLDNKPPNFTPHSHTRRRSHPHGRRKGGKRGKPAYSLSFIRRQTATETTRTSWPT
jgi:hypothetical protein